MKTNELIVGKIVELAKNEVYIEAAKMVINSRDSRIEELTQELDRTQGLLDEADAVIEQLMSKLQAVVAERVKAENKSSKKTNNKKEVKKNK